MSKKKNIVECLFASNGKKYRGAELACRNSGSAALDLAYVACGRYDGFFFINRNMYMFRIILKPLDTTHAYIYIYIERERERER